jgi:hypothetical protein
MGRCMNRKWGGYYGCLMRVVILPGRHSDGAGLTAAMGSPRGTFMSEAALQMELLWEAV